MELWWAVQAFNITGTSSGEMFLHFKKKKKIIMKKQVVVVAVVMLIVVIIMCCVFFMYGLSEAKEVSPLFR